MTIATRYTLSVPELFPIVGLRKDQGKFPTPGNVAIVAADEQDHRDLSGQRKSWSKLCQDKSIIRKSKAKFYL